MALVGSWARDAARPDSDVDLVVLTDDPDSYVTREDWTVELGGTRIVRTQAWGPPTERRLLLEDGSELEVGVVLPTWAATGPVDPGTAAPIATGTSARQTPAGKLSTIGASSAKPARATTAANTTRAAASATHRSCWRSIPRAWRKRITSDPAATTTARLVTARATWLAASSAPGRTSSP
jgi:hypothetical protein